MIAKREMRFVKEGDLWGMRVQHYFHLPCFFSKRVFRVKKWGIDTASSVYNTARRPRCVTTYTSAVKRGRH